MKTKIKLLLDMSVSRSFVEDTTSCLKLKK